MPSLRAIPVWAAIAVAMVGPIAVATTSPLLAWREPLYIAAGFAGIAALSLLLIQPLLVGNHLSGPAPRTARRIHRWLGVLLVLLVAAHVGGLWVTSAPDVMDALLFASPTAFSPWGVVAMWAVFATALLAALRRRLRISPTLWRVAHTTLALVVVTGTVVHALLVEGAMGTLSKAALCLLVVASLARTMMDLIAWASTRRG